MCCQYKNIAGRFSLIGVFSTSSCVAGKDTTQCSASMTVHAAGGFGMFQRERSCCDTLVTPKQKMSQQYNKNTLRSRTKWINKTTANVVLAEFTGRLSRFRYPLTVILWIQTDIYWKWSMSRLLQYRVFHNCWNIAAASKTFIDDLIHFSLSRLS